MQGLVSGDGLGYKFKYSNNNNIAGPGAGIYNFWGGSGGAYGGYGGNGYPIGGQPYGDTAKPTYLGSGGGTSRDWLTNQGNGGGAIHIIANEIIIDGEISCDGLVFVRFEYLLICFIRISVNLQGGNAAGGGR